MDTPICDFVRQYAVSGMVRGHMPGHKGQGTIGVESLDITEIEGADSLYEAGGIIAKSEANASSIFGCHTFYSTEGSSQCIRAMVYLAVLNAKKQGKAPLIAAGRNAHKVFMNAAALMDVQVNWITGDSWLSCCISPQMLDEYLTKNPAAAVYVTSPDYLGNVLDIGSLAETAHRHGALFMVDNAHGAYLKFLPQSQHPMDLGADVCCDSAHKTLPVLTGGAYLHIAGDMMAGMAKTALALFGPTSPSYLILQSLDAANRYLAEEYPRKLADFIRQVDGMKEKLINNGYTLVGSEPLKLTVAPKAFGYTGHQLGRELEQRNIAFEFADPDHLVLMLTPEMAMKTVENALLSVPRRDPVTAVPPAFHQAAVAMTIRQAALSPFESVPVEAGDGRILAAASVGCPPAVPIAVCGERIDGVLIEVFRYYGIQKISVVL